MFPSLFLWSMVWSVVPFFSFIGVLWTSLGPSLLFPGGFASATQFLFYITLLIVSTSIVLFSFYYFASGSDYLRFMSILFSFLLSMVILIFHKGGLSLFVGWDGLGVTSYLLVAYYLNLKSTSGSMTTVMTNRLGDVFLFIFLLSWSMFTSLESAWGALPLFLVICAFTKSAQAPFSSWLPMAMSAPTPVSSLVHSSTLVTAGLYLLMKYSFFWSWTGVLSLLLLSGQFTMFVASAMALAEKDFKKIIALSTLSQLGFMMSSLGLGCLTLSFFHLITHAFFKSCMFVQVGGMIILNNTSQDGRNYSLSSGAGTGWVLGISCLSLCGFPFLSGFFSKDLILLGAVSPSLKLFSVLLFLGGVFLTFLYSLRIMLFASLISPLSVVSMGSPRQFIFSGVFLVLAGMVVGSILFLSLLLPPMELLFLEKLSPLFFWVSLFILPFGFIKIMELWGGMALQDSGAMMPQKLLGLPIKLPDIFMFNSVNMTQAVLKSSSWMNIITTGAPSLIILLMLFIILMFSLGV